MPVCKAEAHRALELLEDYYARLDENEEKELKVAIERVIKIFKSRLFQALLDIQVSEKRKRAVYHFIISLSVILTDAIWFVQKWEHDVHYKFITYVSRSFLRSSTSSP